MTTIRFSYTARVAVLGSLMAIGFQSYGAGFAIIEQSVSGLGNAFAGGAAGAEDATTIFYNPAGLTHLHGTQFIAGAHIISPSAKFHNDGNSLIGGVFPIGGGDGGDGGATRVVPNLYYARDLSTSVKFGLGINAPFGLATEYDRGWVGRYHAVKSELKTVNINPALAFRLNDNVSIGVGADLQYIEADLSNAIDFATVCTGLGIGACAGLPTSADGFVELEGDDWSWGYNLGVLYKLDQDTRFGLAYRSKVTHTLKGDARFTNTPAALQAINAFINSGVSAGITLPETVSVSAFHQLNPKLALMGDVTWTHWNRFKELRVKYDVGTQGDTVTPENWKNSARYALGLSYRYDTKWTLRTGVAYDETPIPSAELRTPRIPGHDRKWIAFGASYAPSDRFTFDVAYAHLFVSDTPIDNTNATGATLSGTYKSDVNILSAQAKWNF